MNSHRGLCLWIVVVAVCGGGCADDSITRAPIFGAILGAEGRNGVVTVTPLGETRGPSATATVVDGRYEFDDESGPAPGAYQARVRLDVATASPPAAPAAPATKQPDKIPNRETFGRDPLHPNVEERMIPIAVPKESPWQVDIRWK
jgi:hypothetical protein